MIFPNFIQPGDRIGVCAPSHPANEDLDRIRFDNGAAQLKKRGYEVFFTDHVFTQPDAFGRSADAQTKAKEFNELVKNKNIRAIISASGGDFLAEMLPYVDTKAFKKDPKWVQGYSDNTSLLYYLTTKLDIATAYGANFGDFGMKTWQKSVKNNLEILEGKRAEQESFSRYQDGFTPKVDGLEGYRFNKKVQWKNLCGGEGTGDKKGRDCAECGRLLSCGKVGGGKIRMRGRLLGGCLDVLMNLAGTPYDGTKQFIRKYKDDGILWFLESFDLHFEQMMESLWKMKEMGWFEHASGFIFGRPLFYPTEDFSGQKVPEYAQVLLERLSYLHVPIILDADIGHRGPQFVMINGAMAEAESEGGKGRLTYLM